MSDQQPILIAGPPRCGTTMLAGLLLAHEDLWVGRARTTWFPGSKPEIAVENQDIKNIMKREARNLQPPYRNWTVPLPEQFDGWHRLKDEIEQLIPDDRRWFVKTSWLLTFDEFWRTAYPEALWVLPWRKAESIFDSTQRHPGMRRRPENMRRRFISALQERQRETSQRVRNGYIVDVYRVSRGDMVEIRALLEFVGIEPDDEKINGWIQPGRMQQ